MARASRATARWPPLRLDGGMQAGAAGGHGPVRYEVAEYEPGRRVRFRFTRPVGFDGYHEFRVEALSGGAETRLTHIMRAEVSGSALVSWPVFFRPLHDALIDDALNKAELELTGAVHSPTSWSPVVRGLRAIGRGAGRLRR